MTTRAPRPGVAAVLFLSLLAAQSGFLTLSPILASVARDFGVSVAVAGQLRTLSGAAGAAVALAIIVAGRRLAARSLLVSAMALLAVGAAASALAPGLAMLALAQVAIGAGVAAALAGGVAGAAEWAADGSRTRVLAWALLGQPAAWVVGMPLIAALAESSWRLAWVAVPLPAALLALLAVRTLPRGAGVREARRAPSGVTAVWRRPPVLAWAVGELLAYVAWSATLVYVGALFTQSYGFSAGTAALVLGASATAYFPGTLSARGLVGRHPRRLLIGLGLAAAVGGALLEGVRTGPGLSAALFSALLAVVGPRMLAGSAFGLEAAPDARVAITGMRAAAIQLGYLLGAATGGAALGAGGWDGLALVISLAFALSTAPHLVAVVRQASTARAAVSPSRAS